MCQCDWEHLHRKKAKKRCAPKLKKKKNSCDLGGDWDVVNSLR